MKVVLENKQLSEEELIKFYEYNDWNNELINQYQTEIIEIIRQTKFISKTLINSDYFFEIILKKIKIRELDFEIFSQLLNSKNKIERLIRIYNELHIIPNNYTNNQDLLKTFLEMAIDNKIEFKILSNFLPSAWTNEIINTYQNELLNLILKNNYIPLGLKLSPAILELYLDNGINNLIFDFLPSAWTNKIINTYQNELINYIIKLKKMPFGLKKNYYFLQICIDKIIKNKLTIEVLNYFFDSIWTNDILKKYQSNIIEFIKKSNIIPKFLDKEYVLKLLIPLILNNEANAQLLEQFSDNLWTEEIIEKYKEQLYIIFYNNNIFPKNLIKNINFIKFCLQNIYGSDYQDKLDIYLNTQEYSENVLEIVSKTKIIPAYLIDNELFLDSCIEKVINNKMEYRILKQFTKEAWKSNTKLKQSLFKITGLVPYKLVPINEINPKMNNKRYYDLLKTFGYEIIFNFDLNNIKLLMDLDDEYFYRIINLFAEKSYTYDDLQNDYDSLKQFEFTYKFPDVINIFHTLLNALKNKDNKTIIYIVNEIETVLSEKDYINITNNPNLFDYILNLKDIDKLHLIINKYIRKKRELYRESYLPNMSKELGLHQDNNLKDFIDKKIMYCFKEYLNNNIYQNQINKYLIKNKLPYDMVLEIINYLIYKIEPTKYTILEITKNIYILKELFKEYIIDKINQTNKFSLIDDINFDDSFVKKEYIIPKPEIDLIELINQLNFNIFITNVISKDEIYASLLNVMKKKKPYLLPGNLKTILRNKNVLISDDYLNLVQFLNYYDVILKDYPTDNMSICKILRLSEVYSSYSSIYSAILTPNTAKEIKLDKEPFKSSFVNKEERLIQAVKLTMESFKRQKITVPPINETFDINGKKVQVVLGNFTNSKNLILGELTGSCMRIGGVAEDFYTFCLLNENGFNIRIENPNTKKLISKVSGFRNGNTVFLNQLRNSIDINNNVDLEQLIKQVAKKIIELTKDSNCPIKNVIISKTEALVNSTLKNVSLKTMDVREGLGNFYIEIGQNDILLEPLELEPINLEKTNVPSYQTLREEPKEFMNADEGIPYILRIDSIKQIIQNAVDYRYLELKSIEKMKYCVVGDDWYLYIDDRNNIHYDSVGVDNRSVIELNYYLNKLNQINSLEFRGKRY